MFQNAVIKDTAQFRVVKVASATLSMMKAREVPSLQRYRYLHVGLSVTVNTPEMLLRS